MSTCRPTRALGWRTRLVLQDESSWGVVLANQNAVLLNITSETLRTTPNRLQTHPIGQRAAQDGLSGNRASGGDVSGEIQPHGAFPLLLRHAIGGTVLTAGSGPYTHQLAAANSLPAGLTVEKQFGFSSGVYKRLVYPGSRVNTFFMRAQRTGKPTWRANLLSKKEYEGLVDLDASPSSPLDNEPFNAISGRVKFNQVGQSDTTVATINSIELTIDNRMNENARDIPAGENRSAIPAGYRVVSGAVAAFFTAQNWEWYGAMLSNTFMRLEFTLGRAPWSLTLVLPKVQMVGTMTPQVGGRGAMNLDIPFTAVGGAPELLATVVTSDPMLSTLNP